MRRVVILSPLKITSVGGGQRPVQLARAFCEAEYEVIISSVDPEHKTTEWGATVRSATLVAGLPAWPPMMDEKKAQLIFQDIKALFQGNYIVLNTWNSCWNSHLLQRLFFEDPESFVVWDIMDLWEEFQPDRWQSETERKLLEYSHAVTAVSRELCEHFHARYNRSIHYLPNALNLSILKTRDYSTVEDNTNVLLDFAKLSFFYVGTVYGEWIDWKFIRKLSSFGNKVNILIAGPVSGLENRIKKNAGNDIFEIPNITFLGEIQQQSIPYFVENADFCILPFDADSKMVQCVSPIKIYEYVAFGGLVLSTDMRETRDLPNVINITNEKDLTYERLRELKDNPRDPIRDFICANTWRNRIDFIQDISVVRTHKNRILSHEDPVFICGTGRCGTTILQRILSNHNNLFSLRYESRFITTQGGLMSVLNKDSDEETLPLFRHKILGEWYRKTYLKDMPGEYVGGLCADIHDITHIELLLQDLRKALSVSQIREERLDAVRQFINGVFTLAMNKTKKRRWFEKTPVNILYMKELLEIFPQAKLIHIYRDGRDVAASIIANGFWPIWENEVLPVYTRLKSKSAKDCAIYWREFLRFGFNQAQNLPQNGCIHIKMEDLISKTEETLRRICDFIGEEFDDSMTKVPLQKHNIGRWVKTFSDKDKRDFKDEAGDLLIELGYEENNDW